jgi:hypothetical protein
VHLNSQSCRRASAAPKSQRAPEQLDQAAGKVMGLHIDFVVKPSNTKNLASEVARLFAEAGLHQEGLQISMLLVSDREVRVVTLLTLWDGERFNPARERLTASTAKLIANFADGPVRTCTNATHFLLPQASTKLTLSDLRPAEIAELLEIVAAG